MSRRSAWLWALGLGCAPAQAPAPPAAPPTPVVQTVRVPSAPGRIGAADLQRAVVETQDGQSSKSLLKKRFEQAQAELDREMTLLKQSEREVRDGRRSRPDDLARFTAVQTRYTVLQRDLQAAEDKETSRIVARLREVARALADEKGLDAIVDKSQALYVRAELDVTDELIRRYDALAVADAGQ